MATKPCATGYITSPYGERTLKGKKEFHGGIDIGSKDISPVIVAAYTGIVVNNGFSSTFGNRIWVRNTEGKYKDMYTVYPHLFSIDTTIGIGKKIQEGATIGIMGNTGYSFGRHLHFEIRTRPDVKGEHIDPVEIIELYKV